MAIFCKNCKWWLDSRMVREGDGVHIGRLVCQHPSVIIEETRTDPIYGEKIIQFEGDPKEINKNYDCSLFKKKWFKWFC